MSFYQDREITTFDINQDIKSVITPHPVAKGGIKSKIGMNF